MLISLFMSIKADIKRSKEKRQRKKKRLAQERLEQDRGTASDAKTAKKPVKHSFYVINKIKAGFVGIIEAIPITVILVRLLIFVIILAMILAILASFVSTIAQAVTDITVAASEALNFSNAFEDMKSSSEMLSDGTVRTILKYNKTANPSDDGSDDTPAAPITFETNDVAFWCSLSDAQIDEYIIKAMTDAGKDINQINKTANLARLIRMAYRICYAGDEDGTHPEKRILKNIEPYTLLGIPYFEKGYSWMQAQCGSAVGYEGSSSYDAWYHLDGDTWVKYTVSDSTAYKYMNIDDSVPEIFLNTASSVGKCAFVDGPLSLSVWASLRTEYANKRVATDLAEAFSSLKDGQALYKALAEPSDSYKAYRLDAYVTKNDKSFSIKKTEETDNAGDGYALASVLPSMLLTALKFESDYVTHFKAIYESTKDVSFKVLAAKNTSEDFEKGITEDVVEYYLTQVVGSSDGKKGSAEYNRYRRALLNILYYSYHHLPGFTSAIYTKGLTLGNTNETGTADDWYKSHALVILSSLHISNGNPAAFTVGTIRNETTFTADDFVPFGVNGIIYDGTTYKYAVAGAWSVEFFGGKDDPSIKTLTNIDGKATEVREKDFKETISFIKQGYTGIRLYDTAKASSEYLTGTLIGYALNKDALFTRNSNIAYVIKTAQSIPMRYGKFLNLHSLCPEGLYATVVGNDIIYQFMSAFGVLSKASDDPMPGIDTKGTFWKTLGFYKGFDNQLQQGILPFKDVTDNDNLLVLGDTTSGKWELAVNEGTGYYRGTTQDHRGIDYLPFRMNGTGAYYNDYALSTLNSCNALYDDIRSAFAKYGSGGKESLYKYYKDKDNSLPDKDFRIPIVSIADGYVQSISCVNRIVNDGRTLGCHVKVRYFVKVGKNTSKIDVVYSHMGSDLIFLWDKRLNGKLASAYASSGAVSYTFKEKEVKIKQGEVLGYMNTTGASATSHLHFAMYDEAGNAETGSLPKTNGSICASLFGMFNDKWVDSGFYPFSDQWLESFDTETNAFSESPEYYEIPSDVFSTILLSKSRDDAIKQVKALMAQKKGSG